ncbi:MAG: hypothetical protein H7343_03725 [Undibacterium sp.]|nr:hypothetical protein [Opitutaceae bacterium]
MSSHTTTVQIRRPSGVIETLDISVHYPFGLDSKKFAAIRQNTRAAGRGEVLGYDSVNRISAADRAINAAAVMAQHAKEANTSTAGRTAQIFKNDL